MVDAPLTPEEISEIVAYMRTHPNARIMNLEGGGWTIHITDGEKFSAITHPRYFLDLIREEIKKEGQ